MHWRHYLRIRTNDPTFLWKMVGGILALGSAAAYVLQNTSGLLEGAKDIDQRIVTTVASGGDAQDDWRTLTNDSSQFPVLLRTITSLHRVKRMNDKQASLLQRINIDLEPYEEQLTESTLDDRQQLLALQLWTSCVDEAVSQQLQLMAVETPPQRFANEAIGYYWQAQGEFGLAFSSFKREGKIEEATSARRAVVRLLQSAGEFAKLRELADEPLYQDVVDSGVRLDLKVAQRDWWAVWWLIPRVELSRMQPGPAGLALFTGFWWFVFALHAGQAGTPRGTRWWLCAIAVVMGILSIWVTDFLIRWQETTWNLHSSTDLVGGLRYFIAGVGLREELSKLLLFAPLAPILARRGNTLETLIVGACVGLGFAILENSHYFAQTMGSAAVGRFAMANFFHMASTSILGLALVRAIHSPAQRAPEACAWFLVIVLAHGLYDAFIVLPALADYSIASSIILVLLAYQFFHELRYARSDRSEAVSLTATFLFSISTVTAATLIYLSTQVGFAIALAIVGPQIISTAVIVYVFLREMPNSLVTV